MLKKQFLCICCPTGCRLSAERESESAPWRVTGNRCPRGAAYAEDELADPRRVVTATVASDSAAMPRIPSGPTGGCRAGILTHCSTVFTASRWLPR